MLHYSILFYSILFYTSKQLGAPTGNSSEERAPRLAPPLSLPPALLDHLFGTYVLFTFTVSFSGSDFVSFFGSVFRGTGVVLREEVEVDGVQLAALAGRTLLLLLGVCIGSTTEDSI